MKKLLILLPLVFVLTGCSYQFYVDREIETIQKCKKIGMGLFRDQYNDLHCDINSHDWSTK